MRDVLRGLLSLCYVIIISAGCNTPPENAVNAGTTASDSLYHLAIGYHDEAMPRMNELMAYDNRIGALIDSLEQNESSRSINGTSSSLPSLDKLHELKQRIANAMQTMNFWMDHFEAEPLIQNEDSIRNYFNGQAMSAKAMRDSIFTALDSLHYYLPPLPKKS